MLGLAVVFAVLMQRAVVEKKRVVETQSNVLVTQANISLESRTPRDPQALANAWRKLLDAKERRRLGDAARKRMVDNFSLDRLAERTLAELSGA